MAVESASTKTLPHHKDRHKEIEDALELHNNQLIAFPFTNANNQDLKILHLVTKLHASFLIAFLFTIKHFHPKHP